MANEGGTWIMRGRSRKDPDRVKTWKELIQYIDKVGFIPLFANEIKGFSVEENVSPDYWWTGIKEEDPWEWREMIARSGKVAYGKFFDKKSGFISLEWLPYFANARRNGYDFLSKWEDGLASRREKAVMDFYVSEDKEGNPLFKKEEILSTELKKLAGFSKTGYKNYPGIMTGLEESLYLVIKDFRMRVNKQGEEYGMSVSVPMAPEAIWGYKAVTSAYKEDPKKSWQRIFDRVKELYPSADDKAIIKMIGRQ